MSREKKPAGKKGLQALVQKAHAAKLNKRRVKAYKQLEFHFSDPDLREVVQERVSQIVDICTKSIVERVERLEKSAQPGPTNLARLHPSTDNYWMVEMPGRAEHLGPFCMRHARMAAATTTDAVIRSVSDPLTSRPTCAACGAEPGELDEVRFQIFFPTKLDFLLPLDLALRALDGAELTDAIVFDEVCNRWVPPDNFRPPAGWDERTKENQKPSARSVRRARDRFIPREVRSTWIQYCLRRVRDGTLLEMVHEPPGEIVVQGSSTSQHGHALVASIAVAAVAMLDSMDGHMDGKLDVVATLCHHLRWFFN